MPMQTHTITIITAGHSDVRPRAAQEQAEQTTRGQQALEEQIEVQTTLSDQERVQQVDRENPDQHAEKHGPDPIEGHLRIVLRVGVRLWQQERHHQDARRHSEECQQSQHGDLFGVDRVLHRQPHLHDQHQQEGLTGN